MDAAEQIAVALQQVRGPVIVPVLRASVAVCLAMCVILFVEKVYMAVVITAVRLLGRRPERQWRWEPVRGDDDPEVGTAAYPMVLVQIPMYNEREVIELSTTPLSSTVLYTLLSCCHAMASLLRGPWLLLALFGTIALQVYQLSIGAACGLSWPSDRIVIQVLDDSTDPVIKVKLAQRTNSRSNDCTVLLHRDRWSEALN
jgi:beta-mannan synthase